MYFGKSSEREKSLFIDDLFVFLEFSQIGNTSNKLIYIIIFMKEKQQSTQQNIAANSDDQNQDEKEEEELQFNQSSANNQSCILWVCLTLLVCLLVFGCLKIAYILQQKSVAVHGQYEEFEYQPLPQNTAMKSQLLTNTEMLVQILEKSYREVPLQDASTQDIINAEKLNNFHVAYSRNLRKMDYENAKLSLSEILSHNIHQNSQIKYQQFLQALALLQLPTMPYQDPTPNKQHIVAEEHRQYAKRWKFKQKQEQFCAVMLLTRKGLISESYYYAIRTLFQQNYSKYKVVIIDNTPELGLQANVIGLLKEVASNSTIILDKINGEGLQGSAVYLALHKYCKGTEFTVILRDTGQLVGTQAFSLLNEAHKTKETAIVASHYLLDVQNVFTNLEGDFRYRVQLYRPYRNSSNPRSQPYKTKYIKSYKTSLLQTLPQSTFHNQNGFWYQYPFQARLQFAALQRACGKHYILPQILYRMPKSNIEKKEAVNDARIGTPLKCFSQLNNKPILIGQIEQELPQIKQLDTYTVDISKLQALTKGELKELTDDFDKVHTKRIQAIKIEIAFIQKSGQTKLLKEPTKNQSLEGFNGLLADFRTEILTQRDPSQKVNNNSRDSIQTLNSAKKNQENQQKEIIDAEDQANQNELEAQLYHQTQSTTFCILLTTQNNQHDFSFFYSMQSVLRQQYSAYRLTVIDNSSKDKTLKLLKRYHFNLVHNEKQKVRIIGLNRDLPRAQLLYFSVRKFCQSNEFLVLMQSGQQFLGSNVLSILNQEHRESRVLAIHSGSLFYNQPSYKFHLFQYYSQKVIKQRTFRYQQMFFNPLRTFRTDLFLRIEENDLKRDGKWSDRFVDFNISYAVLQMACQKIKHLNKVLYKVPKSITYFPSDERPRTNEDLKKHQLPPPPFVHEPMKGGKTVNQSINVQKLNSMNGIANKTANTVTNESAITVSRNASLLPIQEMPKLKPKYQCFLDTFLTINP